MPRLSKEDLEKLKSVYTITRLKTKLLAQMFGVTREAIEYHLCKMGLSQRKHRTPSKLNLVSDESLKQLYCNQKLSTCKIAKMFETHGACVRKRLKEAGITLRNHHDAVYRELNPRHHKGKVQHGGYILVWAPDHPRAQKHGRVYEHILVWEETHSRPLPDGWVIHHLNSIKADNRPKNLIGIPRGNHSYALYMRALKERIRELESENKALESQLTFPFVTATK